jgi:pimeloyl-ACP methyl ester carboxylesterase
MYHAGIPDLARNTMPFTPIHDAQLYYEIHGDGAPLMLIAGLASDSQSWFPALDNLARGCRVIAPDNRWVGRTRQPDEPVSISRMADDCLALADQLGLPTVSLLGHSMGGFVALECAARFPDRVDRLILAATSASASKRNTALLADWATAWESGLDRAAWFRGVFYWIFTPRFFENEAGVREAVRLAVEYPYPQTDAGFRRQVEAIAAYDGWERLSAITVPTLVLAGREDLLFPPGECARLAAAIAGARLEVIEGAAHSIHLEQPEAFTRSVLDFLSPS